MALFQYSGSGTIDGGSSNITSLSAGDSFSFSAIIDLPAVDFNSSPNVGFFQPAVQSVSYDFSGIAGGGGNSVSLGLVVRDDDPGFGFDSLSGSFIGNGSGLSVDGILLENFNFNLSGPISTIGSHDLTEALQTFNSGLNMSFAGLDGSVFGTLSQTSLTAFNGGTNGVPEVSGFALALTCLVALAAKRLSRCWA